MQDLISNPEPTMSSREIADLVNSRHDKVKQSIERLAATQYNDDGTVKRGPIIDLPPMGDVRNHRGQAVWEFRVKKRDSYIIVAQMCPEFTARLVDRWQELEAQQAPRVPTTMAEALRLAADQAEELERQQAQLEAQKPAVEFVEKYTDSTGLVSLTQAAKDLQFKPRAFTKALEESGYLYRTGGALTPYQRYLDQGLFAMVVGEKGGHGYSQTKITTKGKTVFAQRFASEL